MANDYIPRGDAEFNGWLANFVTYANANLVALGLVAGDMTPVTTAQTTWNSKYPAHVAAAAAAIAAREGKDAARTGVEAAVRPLVRRLQASASVDDTERAALGITVPDKEPSPVGPPTTRPVATVDASQRLQHTIDFTDESTPTRRAQPVTGTPPCDTMHRRGDLSPSRSGPIDLVPNLAVGVACLLLSASANAQIAGTTSSTPALLADRTMGTTIWGTPRVKADAVPADLIGASSERYSSSELTFKPLSLSLMDPPEDAEPPAQPRDLSLPPAGETGKAASSEPGGGGGSGNTQNDANNPLSPKITLNLQNYYVPSYYGLNDRQANQLLLRGLLPHDLGGAPQLFRFTLPIADAPTFPDGSDTGLGDLTLMDLFMIKGEGLEFGVGPMLVAPTASSEALGAGKWQAGAAGVVVSPHKWGILGGLVTFQQSFASQGGDTDRDDVTLLTVQPLVNYNLPEGFYLRSTAIWNFDLQDGDYYIPVGLGAGIVREVGGVTINAFIEPQYSVFHEGVAPQWQIFAGVNFQFKV